MKKQLFGIIGTVTVAFLGVPEVWADDSNGIWGSSTGFSQEMQTDRPDFTEGPLTIEPGHFQVESGYTYSRADGGDYSHTLPELLLRLGLGDSTEFRFYWEGLVVRGSNEPMGSRTSATDFSLGTKQRLFNVGELSALGETAELSTILELGIPVGSSSETNGTVQPGAKLVYAQDLTSSLSLGSNLNAFVLEDAEADGRHYVEMASSLSLALSIDDNWGAYLEHFAFYPLDSYSTTAVEHYANGGATYAVSPNIQLDMRTGHGLSSSADDFFVGTGISVRQ